MSPSELEIWSNHFEHHALHPRRVPQDLTDVLSFGEAARIARSLATFQLGEHSDGRTLLRSAERYARTHEMPHLVRIVDLLIREERRHALLLRAFIQDHGMPLKKKDWTDGVFRRVRRLAGLEFYLGVLICAELIGNVYFRALESATNCQRLRVLSRIIVADELAHVGFESRFLLARWAHRKAPWLALTRSMHLMFFLGTAAVVGLTHRSVLRAAGHGLASFVRACLAQYDFYLTPTGAVGASSVRPRIEQVGGIDRA